MGKENGTEKRIFDMIIRPYSYPDVEIIESKAVEQFAAHPETRSILENARQDGIKRKSAALHDYQAFCIIGHGVILTAELSPRMDSRPIDLKALAYKNGNELAEKLHMILVDSGKEAYPYSFSGLRVYSPLDRLAELSLLKPFIGLDMIDTDHDGMIFTENVSKCPVASQFLGSRKKVLTAYHCTHDSDTDMTLIYKVSYSPKTSSFNFELSDSWDIYTPEEVDRFYEEESSKPDVLFVKIPTSVCATSDCSIKMQESAYFMSSEVKKPMAIDANGAKKAYGKM